MNKFLETSKPFGTFGEKATQFLSSTYPEMVDKNIRSISIGRNKDAAAGDRGGYRVLGAENQTLGSHLTVPDRMIGENQIANAEARQRTFGTRVSDDAQKVIADKVESLMADGVSREDAVKRVRDSLDIYTHFDQKEGRFIAEPIVGKVKDSLLPGLATPYWNMSYSNKIFKQPFVQGVARNLVNVVGVPNIWADGLTMFAETFEGMARVSGSSHGSVEVNDSATVTNRMEQLVSTFANIVVDYETGSQEAITGSQNGNFLTSVAIGDREKYARLMIDQLHSAMILFGAPEADFDGLTQIAGVTLYGGTPLNTIWNGVSTTKGADAVKVLLKMLGDMQESLFFLPSTFRINVSPTVYKVLKYTMQSDLYNPTNPLKILSDGFKDSGVVKTNYFVEGKDFGSSFGFELVADPFCAPNTPWNPNASDLMFITVPSVKSALEEQTDLVMAPTPIESFILPNYPSRNGLMRTMLKRVGSIIAPVTGTVQCIRGFGVQ